MAFDRQAQPRHRGDPAGVAGAGEPHTSRADEAARRVDADAAPVLDPDADDLGVLQDVDAGRVGTARVAPGDRVVAHRAAAPLHQPAHDREPRVVHVGPRQQAAHRVPVEQFGVDPVQPHRVAAPDRRVALAVAMEQVQHAALAHHGVEVDLLLQPLPQLQRRLEKREIAGQQVVGANDRRVAADVAAADETLLHDSDVPDPVPLREMVRGREPVAAAADHDHVVMRLRLRFAPHRPPAGVAAQPFLQDAPSREMAHQRSASRARSATRSGSTPNA